VSSGCKRLGKFAIKGEKREKRRKTDESAGIGGTEGGGGGRPAEPQRGNKKGSERGGEGAMQFISRNDARMRCASLLAITLR
jgi:hypothetical protein